MEKKVKADVVPIDALKHIKSAGLSPFILNFGISMGKRNQFFTYTVRFMPWPLYTRKRTPVLTVGRKDEMINLNALRNDKFHFSGMQIYCIILSFYSSEKVANQTNDLKTFENTAIIRKINSAVANQYQSLIFPS